MVEIEESAQAVAPLHVGGRAPRQWRLLQKLVVKSLMVSLAVVVLDVLPREKAQVVLTERDHTIETGGYSAEMPSTNGPQRFTWPRPLFRTLRHHVAR
jgi:hypothetical protein